MAGGVGTSIERAVSWIEGSTITCHDVYYTIQTRAPGKPPCAHKVDREIIQNVR